MRMTAVFSLIILLTGCGGSSSDNTRIEENNQTDTDLNVSENHNTSVDKTSLNLLYKTGQTVSYATGDDGELQKGLPKHFIQEGDVIHETAKDIYWQNNLEIETLSYTKDEAELYCETLSLGGYNDWRLPNLYELQEMIDYSKFDFAMDEKFLYNKNGYIWTSTPCSICTAKSFAIAANSGEVHRFENKNLFSVRCVRGNEYNASRYTRDDEKEVVLDNVKKLMWQDGVPTDQNSEEQRTFTTSLAYCNNLKYAGYNDWRAPNAIELRSLFDFTNGTRAISLKFQMFGHQNGIYWSSTTDAADNDKAWTIDIYRGESITYNKSSRFYIRCVRDIK